MTASWDPNTDNVTVGYVLSWGTSPGNYPLSADTGNATTRRVDLLPGHKYYFIVQAYDAAGQRSAASAEASIDVPNSPPGLANPGDQQNAPGSHVSLQLSGSDPDGDPLTYMATSLPPSLTVDSTTGLISGTVSLNSLGNYCVTATVSDGAASSRQQFTWRITPLGLVSLPGCR